MDKVWKPVATAPANIELELSIYDQGEYHALTFPCRREGSRWRDVRVDRLILLEPTHWRVWDEMGKALPYSKATGVSADPDS